MASIFPAGGNGGVTVRDSAGNPIPVTNVPNAYIPASEFSVSCSFTYLRDDCFSRIAPSQLNAIVSELICFTEGLDPEGTWDCASLCNIRTAFEAWVSRFVSEGIGQDLCGTAAGTGLEPDAGLIYCGNGSAMRLSIFGEGGLVSLIQDYFCGANSVAAPAASTKFWACTQDGVMITVRTDDLRLYRGPWVQAQSYRTTQMVQRDGKLWSPNQDMVAGSPFIIGTTGATWREVSASGFPPFDQNQGYPKDAVILTNGAFYAANAAIPAGTPFEVGTTGQTWRPVDFSQAFIMDYNNTATYLKDAVVVRDGLIYRANSNVPASANFNPSQWDLIGGEPNRYHGAFTDTRRYRKEDMVAIGNKLWLANDNIAAGVPFTEGTTGATWREASPTVLTGSIIPVEMVLSVSGGWSGAETLFAYKAAKQTGLSTSMPGSQGGAALSTEPVDTSATIFIDDDPVGKIYVVDDLVTFDFPASRSIPVGSTLKVVADTGATFDYVTVTFLAIQILL